MFLEGCRGDAPRCGVSADVVSVEWLKKVFEEKGWPHDLSFKREDLATLLESLGVPESEEEDLPYGISDLVDQIYDRAAAKEFPLLRPLDLPWGGRAERCRAIIGAGGKDGRREGTELH